MALLLLDEGAVAFVDVDRLTDQRYAEILLPLAGRKSPTGRHRLAQDFGPLGFFFHRFKEDPTVEFCRRLKPQDMEDRWREIDVAARKSRRFVFPKIRTCRDERIVDIEIAQGGGAALPRPAREIGPDLAGHAKAIRI